MNKEIWSLVIAILGLTANEVTIADLYTYSSEVTLCTGTCASFASLDLGSTINGTIEVNTTPGGSFGDADVGPFTFQVFNPALPVSGPVGDPVNDNPLVLDSTLGIAASNGTSGTTDAANEINGGQMLIEFLVPPFSSNGAFVVFDLSTGNGQICLFFATAGCIPGATEAVKFEGEFNYVPPDTDGDDIPDVTDPDDDNDGISDPLDRSPLDDSNANCTTNNGTNATLVGASISAQQTTCASRETVDVSGNTEVGIGGNLLLIAPAVSLTDMSVTGNGRLEVINADPCEDCTPP